MLRRNKGEVMSNQVFAAPHEWMSFWKKAAEDHVARVAAVSEEWAKLEGKGIEQAGTMVDEMSKLTKESLAYGAQLATEWRKLTLDALKATKKDG
jgi:hypothetical protein